MNRKSLKYPQQARNIQLIGVAFFVSGFILLTQVFGELLIRLDRFQHIGVTLSLFIIFYLILQDLGRKSLLIPSILALGIGFFKEYSDPQFQSLDIASNFFGLFLGFLFVLVLSQFFSRART